MSGTRGTIRRTMVAIIAAAAIGAGLVAAPAAPAAATPDNPVPSCSGTKRLVVDVTQDVRNDAMFPARDGRMWATFDYRQHVRIWSVGGRRYCVRRDMHGTLTSIGGTSPSLTGTISDGLTGTLASTEYLRWTGKLVPTIPTSGHLGEVDAGCTDIGVCADDDFLVLDSYFSEGTQSCGLLRAFIVLDAGEHGRVTLKNNGGPMVRIHGDITG